MEPLLHVQTQCIQYNRICTFITWQLLILLLFVFFLFFGPHYTITKSQWGEYWTFIDCRSTSSQREALRDWFRVSNSFSLFLFFWTTLHNYNVTRWLLNINRWWSTSSQREALWACFRVSTCTGTFTSHTYADATFLRSPPPPTLGITAMWGTFTLEQCKDAHTIIFLHRNESLHYLHIYTT